MLWPDWEVQIRHRYLVGCQGIKFWRHQQPYCASEPTSRQFVCSSNTLLRSTSMLGLLAQYCSCSLRENLGHCRRPCERHLSDCSIIHNRPTPLTPSPGENLAEHSPKTAPFLGLSARYNTKSCTYDSSSLRRHLVRIVEQARDHIQSRVWTRSVLIKDNLSAVNRIQREQDVVRNSSI